ncbi:MAG: ribbon-helix-helix domain-containing protein [Anaerolineaceae bacterium]|nr:ribbon-helix-helix domain-containing protein [Anaerolineaceae bacterium]
MTSKNRVTVNLSDDEFVALGELAERYKVTKAWLGRYAISSLLERIQNDEQQLLLPLTGFKPPKAVGRRGNQ